MSESMRVAKRVPIKSLHGYPGNARRGDLSLIQESLREHGQYRAVVVQKSTQMVLAGNHTWLAAQAEGWTEIDIDEVDVSDDEARKIVLIDNRANDAAAYDDSELAVLLTSLEGDYVGTGFAQIDLDTLLDSLAPGQESGKLDFVPPVPDDPRTELGTLIKLGPHRLLCGSADDPAALANLFDGETFHLCVTSPPYNQGLDKFKPSGMQKENPTWVKRMAASYSDGLPEDEYQEQQVAVLNGLLAFAGENAALFYNHKVRHRDKEILHPIDWLRRCDWRIRQEIVWDRSSGIALNARMFIPADERIYWLTATDTFYFVDSTEVKSYTSVWDIAPRAEVQVSAPYPVEIPRRCIEAASARGDRVLDPYSGSGTTIIACEHMGRVGYGLELNPGYCDVIVQRWEALTGEKAEYIDP
jgi:DNA modification methylase